jgi:alcohol dehydrogenase
MVDAADVAPGSAVQVVFGRGALRRLGDLAVSLEASRVLVVTDAGICRVGHAERALEFLHGRVDSAAVFVGVVENPTTLTVAEGVRFAREFEPDLIVGLGGGSAMDTAKGINFLLTNGGEMADYWGIGKASRPMLPMIAVPTTTGTGSEAQSYALISDPKTHVKMACSDSKALPRCAILDPELAVTQPLRVVAVTGIDALAHAIETAGCTRRNAASLELSRRAWGHLEPWYERAAARPGDMEAIASMQIGAHLAGCAIEKSMLGAAHALANPLTANYGTTHGVAIGVMLEHVIRFNCGRGRNPYSELSGDGAALAERMGQLRRAAGLPGSLAELSIPFADLPRLAVEAAGQWTARFNPVAVGAEELLTIYEAAYAP